MRSLGLFAGVGGLELGFARAGIHAAHLSELDEWKRSVLDARFPGVPVTPDVRDVARGGALRVDVVTGGFPCQDVSVAGRRAGFDGARSSLWWEYARILDAVRPAWVVVENVPGLLSSRGGRDFGAVIGTLAELGYGVAWRVLDARHFGVPQRRRRVFVVGRLGGEPAPAVHALVEGLPGDPEASRCTWQDAPRGPRARSAGRVVAGQCGGGNVGEVGALRRGNGGGVTGGVPFVAPTLKGSVGRGGGGLGIAAFAENSRAELRESDYAPSLSRGGGKPGQGASSVRVGVAVRRLTQRECERLMSWPDDWTAPPGIRAPDSKRYAACGDGIVANVAEWIARRILAVEATL